MKRLHFGFKAACVLLLLWILLALLGSFLKPYPIDPAHQIMLEQQTIDGQVKTVSPPFHPSLRFWFGTDHRGLDILSLVLNGMKLTLGFTLLITVARFAIALPLGLFVGIWGRGKAYLSLFQWVSSSVPPIIFLFPLLYGVYIALQLDSGLPIDHPYQLIFAKIVFVSVTAIGIFPIAHQFSERARFVKTKLFVHASKQLGASSSRLVFRHLIPNLQAEIGFAFLTEFVQVLFLLGQLAVFGIYIGGGINLDYETNGLIHISSTGEWCAMIDYGLHNMRMYPGIIICVGLFFTLTIFILNFFISQLKKQLRTEV
jgi:peptide/nickel transport system permease protein